jgi:hypothetical protein
VRDASVLPRAAVTKKSGPLPDAQLLLEVQRFSEIRGRSTVATP